MIHYVVVIHPRSPRTVYGRTATILGLYVAAALVAGLMAFTRLPGALPTFAVLLVGIGAIQARYWLTRGRGWTLPRAAVILAGVEMLAGFVFVVTTFYGSNASVLALRGATVQATVIDTSTATARRGSTTHLYELAGPAGRPIPGRLSDSDAFHVGDQVVVLVDPDGLVDPETPRKVAAARAIWIATAVSFGVAALMALLTTRSARRVKPASTTPQRSPN
jgi:hypothetical protein